MTSPDRLRGPLRGLAFSSAILLLVAACSSSGSAATSAPTPTAAPPATAAPDTPAPATVAPASAPASAAASTAASPAAAGPLEVAIATVGPGKTLTGADGRTLYIFKKDTTPGKSACYDNCATNWPPVTVASADALKAGTGVTGTLATIKRDDGTSQVTYNGAPLYYFAADKKAGDAAGQGVGGIWFIVAP